MILGGEHLGARQVLLPLFTYRGVTEGSWLSSPAQIATGRYQTRLSLALSVAGQSPERA